MKQTKLSLHKRLMKYNRTAIPMHMPGHKRNTALLGKHLPYATDITEIHGFDNLHDMQGVLKETADLASLVYGAKASFPLVNGTTCGILAAIHALTPMGSTVLMARNCHKSVYNAVALRNLTPHYICPKTDELGVFGKILPADVERALQNIPGCRLVIITSPTYEGVISDVSAIADICHKYGALLLVDSAHGAHLGVLGNAVTDVTDAPDFATNSGTSVTQIGASATSFFPSVTDSGADAVVMSLHKTMPALTQTALLHIGSDHVSVSAIKDALSIYETASPSYVLLSSIDQCLRMCLDKGEASFSAFSRNLRFFYKQTERLKRLRVVPYDDKSKIIISTKDTQLSGPELADILRKQFRIETEMAGRGYVLAMATVCDTRKSLNTLARALIAIDETLKQAKKTDENDAFPVPEMAQPPALALAQAGEWVSFDDASGRVCLDYIFAYPPGIPLVCPGEILSQELIEMLTSFGQAGITLKSTKGLDNNSIWVKKERL